MSTSHTDPLLVECLDSSSPAAVRASDAGEPLLDVVGADLTVPTLDGDWVRYANLDNAASAPALQSVWEVVQELLPWYSSVHRGAGFASQVCTELLESSRVEVARFVGAPPDAEVVFTRNTTDSINLLSSVLPKDTEVITYASHHHANLLAWSRHQPTIIPVLADVRQTIEATEEALRIGRTSRPATRLVALNGASNVTGELWPLVELVDLAHRHGARVLLDAAQLAPHRSIDLAGLGIDYLALSGHKMYAPFGAGALVGSPDWLDNATPYLQGGGAVRRVSVDEVKWQTGPARHEAGTPNLVGIVALAAACQTLRAIGMERVAEHESGLLAFLQAGLDELPPVSTHRLWPEADRLGVVSFNVDGYSPAEVAAVLSAEHGIGVRDGRFCAHPLVDELVGQKWASGGAVRASIGVGTRSEDIERLLSALTRLTASGPSHRYHLEPRGYVPDRETRPKVALQNIF